jgi:hypothetical protein
MLPPRYQFDLVSPLLAVLMISVRGVAKTGHIKIEYFNYTIRVHCLRLCAARV